MNNLISWFQKSKFKILLSGILSPLLSFYSPVTSLLMPILWLVIFDMVTGMYVVRIVNKQPLTSRGLFQKFPQVTMFIVAVSASIHADPFFVEFGISTMQAPKLVISFYGLYEMFSILENLGKSGLPIARQIENLLKAKLPDSIQQEMKDDKL